LGKQKIVHINGNNELFWALFRNLPVIQNICQIPRDMKYLAAALVMIFVPRIVHILYVCAS